MSRSSNFSLEEDEYIRTNFKNLFDDEIAEKLKRPEGSITRRRQRLGCWHTQQEVSAPLPGELWISLGIDGEKYQVSNKGRIRTDNKLSALFINENGYIQWRLVNKSRSIALTVKVHRAVAEAFCNKPLGWAEHYHVHHIDENRQNNSSCNLEWLSPEDHAERHK